jgi:hypothetical protein
MKTALTFFLGLLLGFLLGSRRAHAEDWISSTIKSYHFDRSVKHNEFNIGVGVEHDIFKNTRAVGGIYYNSNYQPSIYFGAMYTPYTIMRARVGLLGGVVNGYGPAPQYFGPLVSPVVTFEGKNGWGFNVVGAPKLMGMTKGMLAIQLKYKKDLF